MKLNYIKNVGLTLTTIFVLVGCEKNNSGSFGGWNEDSSDQESVKTTSVVAISSRHSKPDKELITSEMESCLQSLVSQPAGTSIGVIDAHSSHPIAAFQTTDSKVKRLRMKALAKPSGKFRTFIKKSARRNQTDSATNIPEIFRMLGQKSLPDATHILITGNPCLQISGDLEFLSMKDGKFPSDSHLFESPEFSPYSVVGRENSLKGMYVHIGFSDPKSEVFTNINMKHKVMRFWNLFCQEHGCTLVTFDNSIESAFQAMRERRTKGIKVAPVNPDEEVSMKKVIFIPPTSSKDRINNSSSAPSGKSKDSDTNQQKKNANVKTENKGLKLDKHGNPIGSKHDLVGKSGLNNTNILFVYNTRSSIRHSAVFQTLRDKGANVTKLQSHALKRGQYVLDLPSLHTFSELLTNSDQLWLSNYNVSYLPKAYIKEIVHAWQHGLNLYLLNDNDPFYQESNVLLAQMGLSTRIANEYLGQKIISKQSSSNKTGFDSKSPIFSGINKLYEGSSVSEVLIKDDSCKPIAYGSDGKVLFALIDQNKETGRVIIGCGFTRYFTKFYDKVAGTSRIAVNIAGFLGAKRKQ